MTSLKEALKKDALIYDLKYGKPVDVEEDDLEILVKEGYFVPIKSQNELESYLRYGGCKCDSTKCKQSMENNLEIFEVGGRAFFNALKALNPSVHPCNYACIVVFPPK